MNAPPPARPSGKRKLLRAAAVALSLAAAALAGWWWVADWTALRPLPPSGGVYFPGEHVIPGPHFLQSDPRWAEDRLGATKDSMASVGCAVASAAMVLGSFGVDTDPGRLNRFLSSTPGGYTPQGWIYWEKAPGIQPGLDQITLPHYEDKPSLFLVDSNLARNNPVIARLRYPSGTTHFVVICGKRGFDYLIRDPGGKGKNREFYPLKEFGGGPVEAIRFYRRP